jgi:hypothetical protein
MPKVDNKNATKFYCFTINNPSDDDDKQLGHLHSAVDYLVYGRETGKDGTPHYQGYVELSEPQRFSWLKKRLTRAHLERKQGSRTQARDYCFKEDKTPTEVGHFREDKSGKRNDLLAIRNRICAGDNIDDLEFEFFPQFVRYGRFFRDFYNRQQKPRTAPPKVYVYWGTTGSGKTRKAHEHKDPAIVSYTGHFFQNYHNQKTVIFDEMDDPVETFGRSKFLQMTDRYPMVVNIKNGERVWNPEVIVFTSNREPTWTYDSAVKRRITEIQHFKG